MKRDKKKLSETLDQHLRLFNTPSAGDLEGSHARTLKRLQSAAGELAQETLPHRPSRSKAQHWKLLIAATMVCAVLTATFVSVYRRTVGVVEIADGRSYRIVEGKIERLRVGEILGLDEVIYSNGVSGDTFALNDGSRVEMRSKSEVWLERADDGIRIHLSKGGVIVNAAKQPKGHLYVQTKDVTVSVVGTIFLVNAEEEGSHVTVIEGEVRVQHGSTEEKLLPGQQVATNPLMPSLPVLEEISWSRNIETHLALLQQAAPAVPDTAGATRLKFEVASIKQEQSPPRDMVLTAQLMGFSCHGIDGVRRAPLGQLPSVAARGRCSGRMVNLATLVGYAYDVYPRRVFGAPDWRESGKPLDFGFQIDATAENPSSATLAQLKQMLQSLLEDRFKLTIRREPGECQGYALSIGEKGLKLTRGSGDEEPPVTINESQTRQIVKGRSSPEGLANALSSFMELPVVDRTGLNAIYDYTLTLNRVFITPLPSANPQGGLPGVNSATGGTASGCGGANTSRGARQNQAGETREVLGYDPPIARAVEEQLGLHLESSKVPLDTIRIEHAEKPSEN